MSAKLVVIVGPTGAGKTRLSLELAERSRGEVISCDSQQVYVGMDIGTGKVSPAERARVPHHGIDIVQPDEDMTAARFVALADHAIADLGARGKPAIVCGGTGLYVRALLLGLFEGPPASPEIRAELAALPIGEVRAELERIDPAAAAKIDRNDQKRMIRALEVFRITGEPMSAHQARHDHRQAPPRYRARVVGLAPERDDLYRAIDARVDQMISDGFEAEVAALRSRGFRPPLRSQQAIGYAELHALADGAVEHVRAPGSPPNGAMDRPRAIALIKRNSRHYARRQLSWYRPDQTITWYPGPAAVDLTDLQRYLLEP